MYNRFLFLWLNAKLLSAFNLNVKFENKMLYY